MEVRSLEIAYGGGITVVWGISFDIRDGEILSLVGSNGSGKTTTIRTITGAMKPLSGEIRFLSESIVGKEAHEIVNMGIVQVPEGRQLFPQMSVHENLILGAFPKKFRADQSDNLKWVFSLFPVLKGRLKQKAGSMSGGEQQMVAIGRALMAKPRLLILDEMSLGLAPVLIKELFGVLKTINDKGVAILLVEQNVKLALEVAHRALVMETGRITIVGSALDVLNNEHVKKAYLGI
jgi:branched-chain amino acid transport system ATP-binding protein